jgi:DNA-binding response OmpR family regulator
MTTALEGAIPENVRLTRKERELLDELASHANCVLSRGYLLRNVWGYSDEARTRTVDVHIRRLRKKLERAPAVRIYTVFGQGYVMEAGDAAVHMGINGQAHAPNGTPAALSGR